MILLILLIVLLILIVIFQIAKITEFTSDAEDPDEISDDTNRFMGYAFLALLIFGLIAGVWSVIVYSPKFLPESASIHGDWIDKAYNNTWFWVILVFVITQVLLFYFSFRYKGKEGRKVKYFPKNNMLELIWTAVPTVVLTILVIQGLNYWYKITAVAPDDAMVIEVTGKQFDWLIRYPGPDGKLGSKSFDKIGSGNLLGLDFVDEYGKDDFLANELHIPKGRMVEIKISAQDVLHSFYLPHFRVKMDAVPGLPTRAMFTAKRTNEEERELLSTHPFWGKINPETGEERYKTFNYELACAELCGRGHFSMQKLVIVQEETDFQSWQSEQLSYYDSAVKGTAFDPILHPELQKGRLDLVQSGISRNKDDGHGDESHEMNEEHGDELQEDGTEKEEHQ